MRVSRRGETATEAHRRAPSRREPQATLAAARGVSKSSLDFFSNAVGGTAAAGGRAGGWGEKQVVATAPPPAPCARPRPQKRFSLRRGQCGVMCMRPRRGAWREVTPERENSGAKCKGGGPSASDKKGNRKRTIPRGACARGGTARVSSHHAGNQGSARGWQTRGRRGPGGGTKKGMEGQGGSPSRKLQSSCQCSCQGEKGSKKRGPLRPGGPQQGIQTTLCYKLSRYTQHYDHARSSSGGGGRSSPVATIQAATTAAARA